MKIIISSDMINKLFGSKQPTVAEILESDPIKNMVNNCRVLGVYQDDMNANDLGNYVIKVIPSLKKKGKKHGK